MCSCGCVARYQGRQAPSRSLSCLGSEHERDENHVQARSTGCFVLQVFEDAQISAGWLLWGLVTNFLLLISIQFKLLVLACLIVGALSPCQATLAIFGFHGCSQPVAVSLQLHPTHPTCLRPLWPYSVPSATPSKASLTRSPRSSPA